MADAPETKDELEDATKDLRDALHQVGDRVQEDLRDAMHQVGDRVEEGVARLRPDRGIRKRPVTTACVAGALGFALGSDSGEAAMIALLLLGAALVLSNEAKVDEHDQVERV
jgi:ElaB/YqjD/DUF883 family membrane-anchored ribosome-binding protein